MSPRLAVVINKDGSQLSPSETFLHAHINNLPYQCFSLIGNPGYRVVREGSCGPGRYLASRALVPLASRWLTRHVMGVTVAAQDTRAFVKMLERDRIDVVLAEYGPTAVSVMEACRLAGVPLVVHFHGYDAYMTHIIEEFGTQYRRLFDISSAIIGVSRHMCDQLIRLGAPAEKVRFNACGAEVSQRKKPNDRKCGHRFAMIGRLVEKKAPFVSLMAFAQVSASVPDATLEIVGDGPLTAATQQMVRALGIEDKVTLHGAQSHDFVMAVLERSDYFLQHSVEAPNGDMEGTPVGVLEAMGLGLPVVSTRHGGICDIISENETGILVDEYDVEGMAQAMRCLCENRELAIQMGEKARKSVVDNWTSEKSIARLAEIIRFATC
ncbi:MAG: glycosyltransferase [Marinobacter sp.]